MVIARQLGDDVAGLAGADAPPADADHAHEGSASSETRTYTRFPFARKNAPL